MKDKLKKYKNQDNLHAFELDSNSKIKVIGQSFAIISEKFRYNYYKNENGGGNESRAKSPRQG